MEEKKVTKVSMSTFFLIIAIIAIGVMAFFIYKFNDDKTKANNEVADLKNQVSDLQNKNNTLENTIKTNEEKEKSTTVDNTSANNTTANTAQKTYTYSDLKGIYTGNKQVNGETVSFDLSLYENGTFVLQDAVYAPKGPAGNYTIIGDTLKLNKLFNTTSSIDIKKASGNLEIKINENGTLNISNYEINKDTVVNNIVLTKTNDSKEMESFNEDAVNSLITMNIKA